MRVYFILIKYFSKRTKKNENNIKSQKKDNIKRCFPTKNTITNLFTGTLHHKNKHRISYYIIITDSLYLLLFNIRINYLI
jgi:uncharacterized protein YpmS